VARALERGLLGSGGIGSRTCLPGRDVDLRPGCSTPRSPSPIAGWGERGRMRNRRTSRPGSRALAAVVLAIAMFAADASVVPRAALARPKRLAGGLMSVGTTGIWPGIVDVRVVYLNWSDLEPAPRRFRFGVIRDIAERAHRDGDSVRLRIFAGRGAPDWVKRRFGTVHIHDPVDGIDADVPRWWVRGYMRTYRRLQVRLAARFDDRDLIRAVTITGAMTVSGEPFLRSVASSATRRNLLDAGYTPRKDQRAILASIRAHRPWRRTRQILNLNPWQFVRRDGTYGQKATFTNRAMNTFRRIFGRRAILQNNSIRSQYIVDRMPETLGDVYRHMRRLGGAISFQTAQPSRVGNLITVLEWCVRQGAYGVEVHKGSTELLSNAEARSFDALLEANA
jgi:hypothetical protein